MLTLEFDLSALEKQLDNIETAVGEAIRPAAQAGAQVFYDEVKARVRGLAKRKGSQVTGNLEAAIYQAFDDDGSTPNKLASYSISWNKKKAFYGSFLEGGVKRTITDPKDIEFGTKRKIAYPFLRPAFDAVKQKAVDTVNDRLEQELKGKL